MKRIINYLLVSTMLFTANAYGQQVATASGNVRLVTTAGTKLVLNGGITFENTSLLTSTGDSIYLLAYAPATQANWVDNTAAGAMDPASTGHVFFNGNIRQQFSGKTRFFDFTLRNTQGDTILTSCEVRNVLHLDTGYVYTESGYGNDSLLVSNGLVASIVSGSSFSESWVNGRLSRVCNLSGPANEYIFHIGKTDSLYAPIKLDKFNTNANTYTVEYFPSSPFNRTVINNPPVDHVSALEYWELTANGATTGPDAETKVSLSWRTYSQVSPTASVRDSLIVSQYIDNGGYKWDKTGTFGIHTKTDLPDETFGYIKHRDYMGGYGFADRRFTLGTMSKYNALPVKLIYFTAIGDGNKVRLNWEVANEQDIRTYEVQKSLTASNFSFLSNVSSRQMSQSNYTDFDFNPANGWNYYRLKIIDQTGNFTYSPVRAVKFTKGDEQVSIFPNPATDVLNVLLPSSYVNTVSLQVYGVDGKYISTLKPSVNAVRMNVAALPAGTYILRIIRNNGEVQNYRFVKQ